MSDTPSIVPLSITFEYAHTFGALEPYFAALAEGRALGAMCACCGRVWFPPRMVCACGSATEWTDLPGTGTVEAVTSGPGAVPLSTVSGELAFALIRFDGAGNLALVRCEPSSAVVVGIRGRLARAQARGSHPASSAVFVPEAP
jgi:uncharacterized OB-fold protein